jgi:hypothetical protein
MNTIATSEAAAPKSGRRATTPVAGAIAGMLFAVLFGTSIMILRITMGDVGESGGWLQEDAALFRIAIGLIPFAGLFFLWFIGVARERLGRFEDQFFATVFLGSGLLFLAMVFAAAASAGALGAVAAKDPSFAGTSTYMYARNVTAQIFTIYALRMAAVFLLSQATLWMRTGVMPRWLSLVTYAVAVVLLVVVTSAWWMILVFPAWVLLVSIVILIASLRRPRAVDAGDAAGAAGRGASLS